MRPVDQEFVGPDVIGDCVRASTASILELPLDSVPHFVRDYPDGEWYPHWEKFINSHGHDVFMLHGPWDKAPRLSGYYLASGPCERNLQRHMVVLYNGELSHDPHPTRAGLLEIEAVWKLKRKI